jgi:CubicO group peptidase (beta-lactamase class C family)
MGVVNIEIDDTFSGVVRVDRGGETVLESAHGFADRAHAIPMTVDLQLAMASGSKVFTALAVLRLVEERVLALDTTARSFLGADLPLIADDVTVEHLLGHTSGIGDYIDEELDAPIDAYVLRQPMHVLDNTEAFVAELEGFATAFPAGEKAVYCNGGYVVLALLAERASGVPYHDLVQREVLDRAGLRDTAYLRSDRLPGRAALGYLDDDPSSLRTNLLHLPARGIGDGGAYTTVADVHRFWAAVVAGRVVGPETVERMTTVDAFGLFGLGFLLDGGEGLLRIEGYDAGVSFMSVHCPADQRTWTVIGNTSEGAWPVARQLRAALDQG